MCEPHSLRSTCLWRTPPYAFVLSSHTRIRCILERCWRPALADWSQLVVPGSADAPSTLVDSGCVLALCLAVLRPGTCTHGPPSPSGALPRRQKEIAGTLGRLLRLLVIAPSAGVGPTIRSFIQRYVPDVVLGAVIASTSALEAFDSLHSSAPGGLWTEE
jgi:hypothetical protein